MDPIAHTLLGATLASTGLRRATPLATAILLVGANAPDIDALSYFGAPFQSLQFRRGVTHGLPALVLWPLIVVGLALIWDRLRRLKSRSDAAPIRLGPALALAALAVLSHPALDWLNNYGIRWLMPLDGTWYYGDAVFIIDPWLWLLLGATPFLVYSQRPAALLGWSAFWLIATMLVLSTSEVPLAAKILWLLGAASIAGARSARGFIGRLELYARALLAIALGYIATMVTSDFAERSAVRAELAALGIESVESVMVAPLPANPFVGDVVAATAGAYYTGRWSWLERPHLSLDSAPIARNARDPIVVAAAATVEAQRFLAWSRFPYALVESEADGYRVRFADARYRTTGRLLGPAVLVEDARAGRAVALPTDAE